MQRITITIGCFLLAATAAHSQESWGAKLFTESSHDFGIVPHGSQLRYKFHVKNSFAVALELTSRPGCTCITVNPQTLIVQPKDEADIEIAMDTTRFVNSKTVNIRVDVANGTEFRSVANLRVSAFSRGDVVCNPGTASFGVVYKGQPTPARAVDVEYAGTFDFQIKEIAQQSGPVEATFKELYREPGRIGYRVSVALKPDAPVGSLKHQISLKTNDPSLPVVPIQVEALVQATLEVVPSTVNFGLMKVGEAKSLRVLVKGTKPFQILAVEGTGDGISAKLTGAVATAHFVQLDCLPAKAGDLKRQLKIKVDGDPGLLTLVVEGAASP